MGKESDLLEAARTGQLSTIEKLFSGKQRNVLSQALSFRRGVNPNCQDVSGYTPLHHAVLNGHKEAVELLLRYDASPIVADNRGGTPLHLAAWAGNVNIVETLLRSGISRTQVTEQNLDWDTSLHFAAQYGHTAIVRLLLENGADPNVLNKKDESPLDLACQYGRLEAVDILIRRRPDLLSKTPENRSLLHLAARNGHHSIVQKLLQAGCNINKRLKSGTALHEAALFGKVEVVRVLLNHDEKIDVNLRDNLGETALQKVEDHTSRIAHDVAALIKAFENGEESPPVTSNSSPKQKVHSVEGDDMEPPSVYDNIPSSGTSTLPSVLRRNHTPSWRLNFSSVQIRPKSERSSNLKGPKENYVNMVYGEKGRTPPKKPARVSIGHLLEQLSENGFKEDLSESGPALDVLSSTELRTKSSPNRQSPKSNAQKNVDKCSPPVLPDRNYLDTEIAGDYAMLRLDATIPQLADGIRLIQNSREVLPTQTSQEVSTLTLAQTVLIDQGEGEVYELLSEATSGGDTKSGGQPIGANQNVLSITVPSEHGALIKPVPLPRKSCSPKPQPLPRGIITFSSSSSTPSEEFPPQIPHYDQPPTPNHPPPSPRTAMKGIHAKFSPEKHAFYQDALEDPSCSCDESQDRDYGSASSSAVSPIDLHSLSSLRLDLDQYSFKPVEGHSQTLPRTHKSEYSHYNNKSLNQGHFELNLKQPLDQQKSVESGFYSPSGDGSLSREHPLSQTKVSPKKYNVGQFLQRSQSYGGEPCSPKREITPLTEEQVAKLDKLPPSPTKRFLKDRLCVSETGEDADSSSESDVLRPDESHPFAGLLKGGYCRSYSMSLQTCPEHSLPATNRKRFTMGTDSKDKGMLGKGSSEENDETSEWAQIESIMQSFGAGLVRESVYIRDYQQNFEQMFEGSGKPQSVSGWLEVLGVGQYEYACIANGFDNLDFMGGGLIEEQDLIDIGIQDKYHRKIIVENAKKLPAMKSIGMGTRHISMPESVEDWMRGLLLSDYLTNFLENGITTMDRARDLWEVELENVLEVHMLGHRKRILASLGDWRRSENKINRGSMQRISEVMTPSSPLRLKEDFDLKLDLQGGGVTDVSNAPMRKKSSSLDIDLFKDYSKDVTSPVRGYPSSRKGTKSRTLDRYQDKKVNKIPLITDLSSDQQNNGSLKKQNGSLSNGKPMSSHALTIPNSENSGAMTHEISTQVTPGIDSNIPDVLRSGTNLVEKSGLVRQCSLDIATQTPDDDATLDVVADTKGSMANGDGNVEEMEIKPQWMHAPEALVKGCCNFTASYLGSTAVKELNGAEPTRLACIKLRRSASQVQKVPSITLSISYSGVKFIDTKSKMIITEHEICNISGVSQDEEDMKTFAYITRDAKYDKMYCHVFTVKSVPLATEIILTLGQAFEIAYQVLLTSNHSSSPKAKEILKVVKEKPIKA